MSKKHDDEYELIIAEDGHEVPTGIWYEIFYTGERDYGNDWGYKVYDDGRIVKDGTKVSYTRIRQAGNAARQAKKEYLKSKRNK